MPDIATMLRARPSWLGSCYLEQAIKAEDKETAKLFEQPGRLYSRTDSPSDERGPTSRKSQRSG